MDTLIVLSDHITNHMHADCTREKFLVPTTGRSCRKRENDIRTSPASQVTLGTSQIRPGSKLEGSTLTGSKRVQRPFVARNAREVVISRFAPKSSVRQPRTLVHSSTFIMSDRFVPQHPQTEPVKTPSMKFHIRFLELRHSTRVDFFLMKLRRARTGSMSANTKLKQNTVVELEVILTFVYPRSCPKSGVRH